MSTTALSGVERIAAAFAATGKRAALMPYVMAGFPTLEESARIGEACVQAGADVIELGVPYSDPLADGPVIHAAGTRALAAGRQASISKPTAFLPGSTNAICASTRSPGGSNATDAAGAPPR